MSDNDPYTQLGKVDDLKISSVYPFYVEPLKRRISVTKVDDTLYAFDDICTHAGCPLSSGSMKSKTTIKCQCHGSEFDITSGKVLKGPATQDLGSYPAREKDGMIEVDLSSITDVAST